MKKRSSVKVVYGICAIVPLALFLALLNQVMPSPSANLYIAGIPVVLLIILGLMLFLVVIAWTYLRYFATREE